MRGSSRRPEMNKPCPPRICGFLGAAACGVLAPSCTERGTFGSTLRLYSNLNVGELHNPNRAWIRAPHLPRQAWVGLTSGPSSALFLWYLLLSKSRTNTAAAMCCVFPSSGRVFLPFFQGFPADPADSALEDDYEQFAPADRHTATLGAGQEFFPLLILARGFRSYRGIPE